MNKLYVKEVQNIKKTFLMKKRKLQRGFTFPSQGARHGSPVNRSEVKKKKIEN